MSIFVSARFQARAKRSCTPAASSDLPRAFRHCANPCSDQPFSGQIARSSRYTFSASSNRFALTSTAPSVCRTG